MAAVAAFAAHCAPARSHVLLSARRCNLPFPRCLAPDAIDWVRREPGVAGRWQALHGMGREPHAVVASSLPTQREAAWARFEWLVAQQWLPPPGTVRGAPDGVTANAAHEVRYRRAEEEYKRREQAIAAELGKKGKWNETAKRVRWARGLLRQVRQRQYPASGTSVGAV